jgi:hypothetical protein
MNARVLMTGLLGWSALKRAVLAWDAKPLDELKPPSPSKRKRAKKAKKEGT